MKNYKYSIADQEIIVTEGEHQKIQDARSRGATQLTLRDGELGMNLSYFQFFVKTDKMPDFQEQKVEQEELLKLRGQTDSVYAKNFFSINHDKVFAERGWNNK